MMEHLVNRIIRDNTCVIEGSVDELHEAWRYVRQWTLEEECKERKIDHVWIRQLNDAEHAISERVKELTAAGRQY
jgi:uncharacterized protein YqgV (UPF0045/DUF77 family)